MNQRLRIFLTGMVQVFFVVLTQWHVAQEKLAGAVIFSWCLSFVWCFNVKSAAFGTLADKVCYTTGAAAGTAIGLLLPRFIY